MSGKVGIWIDHEKAVLVFATKDHVSTRTLTSSVGPHPHYAGAQDGGGEQKYEERHIARLEQFCDEVVSELGQPEAVVIFGPADAKLRLRACLARSHAPHAAVVDVETADSLTEAQIVAKVKAHYGWQPVRLD